MKKQIWYEDFNPGLTFFSKERLITYTDIDIFAALTGERHPVHMDDEFARAVGFRGRIAHGLFALAIVEGLKSDLGIFQKSISASLGWNDVNFSAPMEPGDRVHLRLELIDRRTTSKPGRGLVRERAVLLNAQDREIVSGIHILLIMMKPSNHDEIDG